MWAFDMQEDWDYLDHVRGIFEPYGAEFYYVELLADKNERLRRNTTENRLANKASKRDIESSNRRLLDDDKYHRFESYEGEIPYENYLKINNTDLPADEAAKNIKATFGFN
jgi:hypothetical protein